MLHIVYLIPHYCVLAGRLQTARARVGSAPVLWAAHRGPGDPQHICTFSHPTLYTNAWQFPALDMWNRSAFHSRLCCSTSSARTMTRLRSPEETVKPSSTEKRTQPSLLIWAIRMKNKHCILDFILSSVNRFKLMWFCFYFIFTK